MINNRTKGMAAQPQNRAVPKKSKSKNPLERLEAPAAISYKNTSREPNISRTKQSFRVSHRELVLGSIAGSTTFTVQSSLSLNPGLTTVFPWLAPQAIQWQQYRIHKLLAEYVPLAPTSTQGDIILSPDYDASNPAPTTETQAANNRDSVEFACWSRNTCYLDVAAMMGLGPRRFVRATNVGGDIKTFDVGRLFVCSNNQTGTSAVGKLYLEYDIEFFTPQNSPSTASQPTSTSWYDLQGVQTIATATPTALNFTTATFDPIGVGTATAGVFTPAAGVYRLTVMSTATDSAAETFTLLIQMFKNGASTVPSVGSSSTGTTATGKNHAGFDCVVAANGTDTFQVQVTLTGAAGTLTLPAGFSQILWELA